jgi:hypothetical protein
MRGWQLKTNAERLEIHHFVEVGRVLLVTG